MVNDVHEISKKGYGIQDTDEIVNSVQGKDKTGYSTQRMYKTSIHVHNC